MNKKHQLKKMAREEREVRHAKKVVNGIFLILVLLAVLVILGYTLVTP